MHRLHNNGSHIGGGNGGFEDFLNSGQCVFNAHAVQLIGVGCVYDVGGEGAETQFVGGYFAGEAEGEVGAAMVAAEKGNYAAAAGVGARHFNCVFHRFGAGGEEKGFRCAAHRGFGIDFFRRAHIAFVGHHLVAGVAEFLQLLGHGGLHFGVQMAGVEHADAAGKVDVALAFGGPNFGVFGAFGVKIAHNAHTAGGGGQAALGDFNG